MAYDIYLGERISRLFDEKKVDYIAKKMMGGLVFMVDDKMCVGIVKEDLMARINPDIYESSLEKVGCVKMDFTGRGMKGFVYLKPDAIDLDDDLAYWLQLALDFNPLAKSSKSKKKKKS